MGKVPDFGVRFFTRGYEETLEEMKAIERKARKLRKRKKRRKKPA